MKDCQCAAQVCNYNRGPYYRPARSACAGLHRSVIRVQITGSGQELNNIKAQGGSNHETPT